QLGRVDLSWTDNSSNETGFEIAQDDEHHVAATTEANRTSTLVTGLDPAGSYHWYVRACNLAVCSEWVGPIGRTADGTDSVSRPVNLAAISVQPGTVTLSWADNSSNEVRFEIAKDDSLTVFRNVAANTTSISLIGLDTISMYRWYVRACSMTACSP